MQQYRSLIEEIEMYLSASPSKLDLSPSALQEVMKNQHQFFLALAAHASQLHERANELRQEYLELRKKYFNDNSDPFKEPKPQTLRKDFFFYCIWVDFYRFIF